MARRMLPIMVVALLVVAPLRAEEWEPGKTHAVMVGVLEWKNGLGGFSKKHRKDQELRDLLVNRGVPEKNISLLLDKEATLPNIRAAIDATMQRAGKGSTLIVYYAGHGMPCGTGNYCFANYEIDTRKAGVTGWNLKDLGETLAKGFKGNRVILWADCCYSGGLEVVVERLAKEKIDAVNLTSASSANASTSNWTFTQSIIDGLRGEPLVDGNSDGTITLGEMAAEVCEAMQHMEGQKHGFTAKGVDGNLVMAKATGSRPKATGEKFAPGCYVKAADGGRQRPARVVAHDAEKLVVQFYDYCDKRTAKLDINQVAKSDGQIRAGRAQVANVKADCEVEWQGAWYPAKVLKKENGKFFITYVGYDSSWDEWVENKRIRLDKKEDAPARK